MLHFLLASASLLALVPVAVLFTEVVCAMQSRRERVTNVGERPPLAVIMPAHDEALIIADTLRALSPELRESDRVLVVADNCSDDTAALAAAEGAEVVVRHDATHRGKGYALDYGLRRLEAAPPQVVLIIDADCRIDARSLNALASLCLRSG